ncbi:MAG: hypothetical protein M0P52_07740 [Rhodoferax sp.]|nr:hypothetical protein [Rhodoferax sp.]
MYHSETTLRAELPSSRKLMRSTILAALSAAVILVTVTSPETTPVAAATQQTSWRDEMRFTLKPGEGMEVKLRMKEGEKTVFAWTVEGGTVNYDTHGDSIMRSISYEKGRAASSDDGDLVAAFTGKHGWFWRNRGDADVKLVLRTRGDYSDIKRVK